jgi:hypothetical protein
MSWKFMNKLGMKTINGVRRVTLKKKNVSIESLLFIISFRVSCLGKTS